MLHRALLKTTNRLAAIFFSSMLLSISNVLPVSAQDIDDSVPVSTNRNIYFGDLHLHTSNSFDAAWGGVRTTREDAYRYAQGFPVMYLGHEVKRKTPLDFLAIADHAEYIGVAMQIIQDNGPFSNTDWPDKMFTEDGEAGPGFRSLLTSGFYGTEYFDDLNSIETKRTNWQAVIDSAENFNDPGTFTAFTAFEWSNTPDGSHFHRNVIFKGPEFPALPFSALDSRDPEDLWRYADNQRNMGIDSILIPHNMNLSGGRQFAYTDFEGEEIDREFADLKARNETLVEITQIKGSSETHPVLSPTDEFAGFEILEHYQDGEFMAPNGSYAREGLARGMEIADRVGANPYQYGFVGSSDYHSSTSATEEDNHTGALGTTGDNPFDGNAENVLTAINTVIQQPIAALSASGITGIWAEQNTRESLFAAMKRREVYATSGPRIQVRMFASWNYKEGLVHEYDWITQAYANGVPMGGELQQTSNPSSPRFLLHALKDADGGNLDRIQIVKVWYADGESHEKTFDAVWAGDRQPDLLTGKVPAIENTVRTESASYSNTIGAVELNGEWTDPEFNPDSNAAYYARVLQIPTPRWSTYLAVRNELALPDTVPEFHQERAWTSPVFYNP